MSVIAPGFTDSVPKFKGCNKFALNLVPASRYWGCTGTLRQDNSLYLVHLSRFTDLVLQAGPLLVYGLPRCANFVRRGPLHFVLFLLRLIRRDEAQHSIWGRRCECMQSHHFPIGHHQFVELHMNLTGLVKNFHSPPALFESSSVPDQSPTLCHSQPSQPNQQLVECIYGLHRLAMNCLTHRANPYLRVNRHFDRKCRPQQSSASYRRSFYTFRLRCFAGISTFDGVPPGGRASNVCPRVTPLHIPIINAVSPITVDRIQYDSRFRREEATI